PFGFPSVQSKKWEMNETRFAQTTFISDPFSAPHKRQLISGILCQKQLQRQRQHQNNRAS
ncbi:MAG: hypothetical protein V4447_00290, partial [Pseudomonadota bacterium]